MMVLILSKPAWVRLLSAAGILLVILGIVGDVTGHVFLLQATDPVLEAGSARNRPRTDEALIAFVR